MVERQEDVFYYVTLMNENYEHPGMPQGAEEGILKGLYLLRESQSKAKAKGRVQLLGSGTILREVLGAAELLEAVRLPDPQRILNSYPHQLSGGQQQRVAGARALVSKPEIVYADEPTGNLDSKSGVELLSFLRSAVDDHRQTIVMVTHDPSAASFADRVVFLSDGHVVDEMRDPTSERVLDRLKSLEV